MTRFLAVIACFTLAALAPLTAQNEQRQEYGKKPERTITAHPSENNPTKGIDETDQEFMKEAAIGDQAEVQLGQMAQQKASDPAVKNFGERMMKDHSDASDKLKNIAESQHIALPIELDPPHKDSAAALSKLSGQQFDQAYMQLMVQEHTKDVDKFKKEAADAHDDTIKQFAAATLPTLQSHLNEAQQILEQLKAK
jgi:putative membrane protein